MGYADGTEGHGPDGSHLVRDRARIAHYPAGAVLGARILDDHELVLILSGSAVWTSDGGDAALGPGSVVLARPGSTDDYRWDPLEPTRHAYVHFTLTGADGARVALDPVVAHHPTGGVLGHLFRYLVWLDAQEDADAGRLASAAFDLLLGAVRTGLGPDLPGRDELSDPVRAAVTFVRGRWAGGVLTPVSIEDLATAASASPRTLARAFRADLALPPGRAFEAVRLSRATALVRSGRLPLRVVAATCGFADAFHLSRRISAVYGVPPTVLRERAATADPFPPGVRRLEHLLFELAGITEVMVQPTPQPPSTTTDWAVT